MTLLKSEIFQAKGLTDEAEKSDYCSPYQKLQNQARPGEQAIA
jgi:hypothetical protein